MNHTSLSRDDLIKSALSAIQNLDFIFTRLVDNPSEKQSNHLLPAVSRPLDHIREVTMVLDNQFMQQFNRIGRSNPGTFHPNSGVPFPNFGAPPPHMGNHNTFAPYMHMVSPRQPGFNVGGPYPQMLSQQNPNLPPWAVQPGPNMPIPFMSTMQSFPVLQPHNFGDKDCFEALLKVIKSLKNDPKAVDVVTVLLGRIFPVQDSRLDPSLRLLTASVQNQLRIDFSEEETKEILQAIEAYLERWVPILDGQKVQPPPQLELEDWKAIMEACGTLNSLTETRLPVKKLILIIAKSKVFACEKFDLSQLVLDVFLSFSSQPLMELKEKVKQVIATWPKKSATPHNPFDDKETPDVYKPFLFNNIIKLRNIITVIDNIFNGGQSNDGGPKLTMSEHAIHVNKLLKNIKVWSISKPETNFNAPPFVVQCPADWSKVQIHVTKELQHLAMRHLEAISHPDCVSRLTPTDWEFIEKVANNIDLMKKRENILRSTLFYATDKDFIGNNQVSNSHRVYAFHRLINNFVFFNGNDEENFAFINSLVMKD